MGQEQESASRSAGAGSEDALRFLQLSARLLLEYNMRTELLRRRIDQLAHHFGVGAQTVVGYRDVTIVSTDGRSLHAQTRELRINVAVSVAALETIDALCANRIGLEEATHRLETVERTVLRHNRWLVAALFGLATSAFAWLLGGDWATVAVSGVASSLGLLARQELGKRDVVIFALPFTAALIGGVLGGIAIRLGWIHTPGLCLIVPALMLVPGPQLINGVDDLLENHMHTAVFRLVLAMGILLAAALGALTGTWLVWRNMTVAATPFQPLPMSLPLDAAMAGLAACGIGAFYNSPWRVLWISILCGMVGHGVRYIIMQYGVGSAVATLLACVCIGVIADIAVRRMRLPFSAVAFAGAVTMMPGLLIFESIAGAIRMALAGNAADPAVTATTLALFFKAGSVIGAMAIGLLGGARLAGLTHRPQQA